jgi:hypothetical protein
LKLPCYFYFSFEVDFDKLEGRYAGSSNVVKIQRNMEKHPDVENCPEITTDKTKTSCESLSEEDENVLFDNMKDVNFIKL